MKKIFTILCFFTSPFLFAQLPAGSIAQYQLNNSAVDISGNGYHGNLIATTVASNRFLTIETATGFDAGVSYGTLPGTLATAMANNFSIGFWFNSSMTANPGDDWYSGNSLIDAEVCGGTSDWGIALINGGKIAFGLGDPDITIKSVLDYNDGLWHFVTATRNMSTGTISLYVDGIPIASTSGTTTGQLLAPNFIGLAANPCSSTAVYNGIMDDIIVYDRELSVIEAANLYTYFIFTVLPLKWVSFTGIVNGNSTDLKWQTSNGINNDRFEIERSTDGIHFSVIGSLAAGDGTNTFKDAQPVKGNNFYRIKQIDRDGKYSHSSTIKIGYRTGVASVYLQTNPVGAELVLINSNQALISDVQITDMTGRIVSVQKLLANHAVIKIPVQKLQPGYYKLRMIAAGSSSTISFLKQ